jgi:hypothetical protein
MSPTQLLRAYRLFFVAAIVAASVQALFAERAEHAVTLVASAEILGALGLAWRRTQWLGAYVLLGVFASAQVISALHGEWPIRFVLYAASALLIVTMDRALGAAGASGGQP